MLHMLRRESRFALTSVISRSDIDVSSGCGMIAMMRIMRVVLCTALLLLSSPCLIIAHASRAVIFRKKLRRDQVLQLLTAQPACTIAMEACSCNHYWAREIAKLGHEVRHIPPDYVKPFMKRQKNDAADAEAICEAAQRPSMRFVAMKGKEQQAAAVVFRARDLLVP